MKRCPKCESDKELKDFGKDKNRKDGLTRMCKSCKNRTNGRTYEQNKIRYHSNIEKEKARALARRDDRLAYNKKYFERTHKERLVKQRAWYEENKERVNHNRRVGNMAPEDVKLKNAKIQQYINSDTLLKFKYRVRNRVYLIFRAKGIKKKLKSLEYIGCTLEFLKGYIEAQFKEGMTWENNTLHGWHVDHIIPLSSANTEEEVKALCHYTNLQPLWSHENLKKSDSMPSTNLKIVA